MKLYLFLAFLLLASWPAQAESRRVIAIVDTGVNVTPELSMFLCANPGYDFTHTDLKDRMGHGTAMTELAMHGLDPRKVCFIMIKWLDSRGTVDAEANVRRSINYAVGRGARVINLSLGGTAWSVPEQEAIERALAAHVHVVVAAGNDSLDMSRTCPYFPACYRFKSPYFHVVGSYDGDVKEEWSNFGPSVTDRACGAYKRMRGTSISAARVTNRIAKRLQ